MDTSMDESRSFLPDFCGLGVILSVLLIAELMVLVVMLVTWTRGAFPWELLGILSMFVIWIVIASMAMLCALKKPLAGMSNAMAGLLSLLVIVAVTGLMSELAWWANMQYRVLFKPESHLHFTLRNLLVGAIVAGIALRLVYLQHLGRQSVEARARARIDALVARIRPHFLFNSMNTIAALIATRPQQAEQAVEDLADLFRASLRQSEQLVCLADEMALTRKYLELESLRLGERLRVVWEIDPAHERIQVPPLSLQPLVENAIYHGIEALPEGGRIRIYSHLHNGCLKLAVENPVSDRQRAQAHAGHRIALDNIRERLDCLFESGAGLDIQQQDGMFRVCMTIPAEEHGT